MNHKRVERIWRDEGLKVPQKQPHTDPTQSSGVIHRALQIDRMFFR